MFWGQGEICHILNHILLHYICSWKILYLLEAKYSLIMGVNNPRSCGLSLTPVPAPGQLCFFFISQLYWECSNHLCNGALGELQQNLKLFEESLFITSFCWIESRFHRGLFLLEWSSRDGKPSFEEKTVFCEREKNHKPPGGLTDFIKPFFSHINKNLRGGKWISKTETGGSPFYY